MMRRRSTVVLLTVGLCLAVTRADTTVGVGIDAVQAPLRALVGVTFPAHVVSIIDGDTIDVVRPSGTARLRIRLEGIDAPETGEPFSQAARTRTRVLAFDQDVRVQGRDVDRYGRLVARVVVEHGASRTDLSVTLAADGLACHYRQYSSDPALARAEATARAAGLGFWAPGTQKPACVARNAGGASSPATTASPATRKPAGAAATRSTVGALFIGNTHSHVFHAAACPNAGCPNCTRRFASRAEAEAEGFTPAGDCLK